MALTLIWPHSKIIKNIKEELSLFVYNYHRHITFSNFPNQLDKKVPKLYTKNELWNPDTPDSADLIIRCCSLHCTTRKTFWNRLGQPKHSLLPNQVNALCCLLNHPEFIVLNCDKNLQPTIMNRNKYLDYVWKGHLSDVNTYE